MDERLAEEFREAFVQRAAFYRVLASIYFKEVTDEVIGRLDRMPVPDEADAPALCAAMRELKRYLVRKGPDPRTDLAVDYARAFLAAGVYEGDAACPFESIYTSEERLIMQDARDEVRAVYLANGVNVDQGLHLPEDHLSFELEFMAIMSDRAAALLPGTGFTGDLEGLARNLRTQRAFAQEHIANWLPAFEKQVVALTEQGFYPAVTHIAQAYVDDDVALLGEMLAMLEA